jgi:hypothetical protein|tara:strand:- start:242 stop:847 length:606 start_codon:yes stop_codon:yes gene_type:complete
MYGMKKEYGQPQGDMPAEQPMPEGGEAPAPAPDPQMEMEQQFQQMADAAPQPEKPFTVKVIDRLVKTLNKLMSSLSDADAPDLTFDPGEDVKGGKFDKALPADLFITLVAVTQLLEMVGGGEFASKYGFDPYTAVTDTDLRKITAQLERMAKDKKFMEAIKEMAEGEDMAGDEGPQDDMEPMAPAPTEMTAEDEELASAMA